MTLTPPDTVGLRKSKEVLEHIEGEIRELRGDEMEKLLKPGQTVDEWVDEVIGDWIEEKCPLCGSQLLGNKAGDKWCSFVKCKWNTWDEDCPHDEGFLGNGHCKICGEHGAGG